MKILIDARVIDGKSGGVQQFIISLADVTKDFPDDFVFYWLINYGNSAWLEPFLSHKAIVVSVGPRKSPKKFESARKILKRFSPLVKVAKLFKLILANFSVLEREPKVVADIDPDVVHFPSQVGFLTSRPNVYHPHDLQHKHFPDFFTKTELLQRERLYFQMMDQASVISVGNEWTLRDFKRTYPQFADKLFNVPLTIQNFSVIENFAKTKTIFEPYFFYPAAAWNHKNHERLLKAFKLLKQNGYGVNLILSGNGTDTQLADLIEDLDLKESVRCLGHVDIQTLKSLYINSLALVVPTLFESASYPIWEAFNFSKAVAASNVTSIPEQVAGSALLFDPYSITSIYDAMKTLLIDIELRKELAERGYKRVSFFTSANSASGFSYTYRRALRFPMNEEDNFWLQSGQTF